MLAYTFADDCTSERKMARVLKERVLKEFYTAKECDV